jgi:hypothetical protein
VKAQPAGDNTELPISSVGPGYKPQPH